MSYIGQEPGLGQAEHFIFTASGSETSVSTADDGLPISYTVNQVSVYLNGVKLIVGTGKDCQATNGSTITGLSALAASDVVEVVALSSFSAADSIPSTGGAYTGQVTLPSPVINTAVSGSAVLDEDAMGSNSATKLATQQSIKAYVDAQTHDSALTTEQVQDIAGGMFSSNTETGITATYQDGDGTVDLVVGTLNQDTTGTAATVTGAAQSAITSVGTLTTLTVDNVIVNGTTIGHTSDTDLLTLTSGNLAVAGDLETSTTGKIKQKGAFMQSSFHQSLTLGY